MSRWISTTWPSNSKCSRSQMTSFLVNVAWDPSAYALFKQWSIVVDQASRLENALMKNSLPNSFLQSTHATRSGWSSAKWYEITATLMTPSSTFHNLFLKSYTVLSTSPFPQLSRWKSPKQQSQQLSMERKTAATLEGATMESTRKRNLPTHATRSRTRHLIRICTCFPMRHGQPILQTMTSTRGPNGMTNVTPAPGGSSKSNASQTSSTRTATLKPTKFWQTVWQAWKPGLNSTNPMTIDWSGWGPVASNHHPNLPILPNQTAWGYAMAPRTSRGQHNGHSVATSPPLNPKTPHSSWLHATTIDQAMLTQQSDWQF